MDGGLWDVMVLWFCGVFVYYIVAEHGFCCSVVNYVLKKINLLLFL